MYAGTLLDIAMTHSDNLISRAQEGDKIAFDRLVKLWYRRIYNFAFKYFADHDLSMEVTQRTFISMYAKIGSLREVSKFRPWLYRIASNFCHEEERKSDKDSHRQLIHKLDSQTKEINKLVRTMEIDQMRNNKAKVA